MACQCLRNASVDVFSCNINDAPSVLLSLLLVVEVFVPIDVLEQV